MIGPHTRKELELMLTGTKPMAMFFDYYVEDGSIPEEIIPETAFKPHVENGTFVRISRDFRDIKHNCLIRFVCFTRPDEVWRAQCVLWMKEGIYSGVRPALAGDNVLIGRLLGYAEEDIQDFIEHRSKYGELRSFVA